VVGVVSAVAAGCAREPVDAGHRAELDQVQKPALGGQSPVRQRERRRRHRPGAGARSLRALRRVGPLTFPAVPPRSGRRIALDRDLDGVLGGDR